MRTNSDSWTITSSVGRTALLVALGRAIESRRDGALIDDPIAPLLIEATGEADLTPERVAERTRDDADMSRAVDFLADIMAGRTRVIDDAILQANRDGVRQVVLLAAGLDARAVRLDWAPGTTVFEVDQPAVIDFKDDALRAAGAQGTARRVTVARDLREDWWGALADAGFATDQPTFWLCEGLLPYLLPEDQAGLLGIITEHSPAGSRLMLDAPTERIDVGTFDLDFDATGFGIDIDNLLFDSGHFDARGWLDEHGWATSATLLKDVLAGYGRVDDGQGSRVTGMLEVITGQRH